MPPFGSVVTGSASGGGYAVTLTSGEDRQDVDFGNYRNATVSGVKFEDGSPITSKDIYGCCGYQNDAGYCNRRLSAILTRVSTTLDAGQRATMLNEGEARYMVKDIPSIPMVARPFYLIRSARVKGPVLNPTQEGTPWNVNTWTVG